MTVKLPWRVRSDKVDVIVQATDSWEAWDAIADRPLSDFGLLVTAECNEDANPVGIRTSALMFRWNRDADAAKAIEAAVATGLPDTRELDLRVAGRKEQQ